MSEQSEPQDAMSTIEKAAAKLAARGRSSVNSPNISDVAPAPSHEVQQPPPPEQIPEPVMQGKAQGFTQAAAHYCDIDLKHLVMRGYLRPGDGRSQLAQEMRRIKRPLLMNIQRQNVKADDLPPANLIMITSALPEEGKTFIAINLALSLAAELDRRVLLVDGDVSKGEVTEQLRIEAHRGLSDLLHETNYISEDAVLTSNVERLSILAAGGATDHTDELFASELMETILHKLATADPDRVVVFDSPPLLETTEGAVLAHHMGQVVMVVEANRTPQDAVTQSVQMLEGCANVSLVLNKTTGKESGAYGYGYARRRRRPAEAQNAAESMDESLEPAESDAESGS